MAFLGVYRAIYDYQAQSDQELAISEGDLLYVLEKSAEDDWWKAKKRAAGEEDEEPVGLIPSNYIEEVRSGSVVTAWSIGLGSCSCVKGYGYNDCQRVQEKPGTGRVRAALV